MSEPQFTSWLSSRLDEVEALAKSAASCGDTWTHNKGGGNPHLITGSRSDAYRNSVVVYDEGAPSEAQADHIATFDPAMVLRLVAATRAVLELHKDQGGLCETCDPQGSAEGLVGWPCPTIQAVAAGWGWVDE